MRFSYCERAFLKCMNDAKSLSSEAKSTSTEAACLRGSILLGVSAFDFLIHEIVRLEILHRLNEGLSLSKLEIPANFVNLCEQDLERSVNLLVRERHSYKAFASSKNVKEACKPFNHDIWDEVQLHTFVDKKVTCKKLDQIWKWRNRIAHEGDFVPSNTTFNYWPIHSSDVDDSLFFS